MNRTAAMAKIRSDFDRHRHLFDLDSDNLGRDLCKAATDGVQETIAAEEDPDGARWADLSKDYDEWKRFNYPGNPIALLHGVMINPREVAGEIEVSANRAEVTYGVSEQARNEAEWFQEGDPKRNRPARPFWGFTADSIAEAGKILDKRFKTV